MSEWVSDWVIGSVGECVRGSMGQVLHHRRVVEADLCRNIISVFMFMFMFMNMVYVYFSLLLPTGSEV